MATYFLWGSIGLIVVLLLVGFLVGMYRGLKRTSLHILFVLVSVVIAFFVTRPITNAILNVNINYEGSLITISDYIVRMISENVVDLSHFDSASEFIKQLPGAIASPIVFIVVMLVMFLIFEIIYLITARISFGSKKKDFSTNKPHRLPGGFIAMAETFMFFLVLFAPITSLTHTYEEIVTSSSSLSTSETVMPTLGEELSSAIPPKVHEAILSFNDSAFGAICSAGGFDDALFDGLSDVKIDGEKINVRYEIVTLAGAYDDVAIFVNEVSANNFETLNFAPLKASVTEIVKNNLFKTVITDTLKDFIVNFDTLKEELALTDIPNEVVEIIHDLQAKLTEGFDFYTYLSSDILDVLDIADSVITNGVLEEYMALENVGAEEILNLVVNNDETVSTSLKNALTLNLVSDTLPRLLELLSSELQKNFENAENIGLNTTLTREDMESMVDSLMSIATELKTLNDQNDIFGLIESEDIVDSILNLNDIGGVLDGLGGVLDEAHSLKILNFERESGSYNTLDGIMESMGFILLGDDVHVNGTLDTIDTYSDFFNHIKTPILSIKEAGLTDILNENTDFDAILDIIKTEVQTDSKFLAKLLMPFYDLDQTSFNDQTLKAMVFDTVIDQLSANLDGFIKLDEGEDTYENYYAKLASIGELLGELSSNSITVTEDSGEVTYDYFDYILLDNADYFALISDMQKKNVIENILTLLFENNMYSPLYGKLFPQIDSELGGITGVTPTTDYNNIAEKSDTYIEVIKALLDVINDESMNGDKITDKLPVIGKVLDTLKVSAESGVFDDVFVNIIWYLTGDVIDENPIYVGQQANSEYERIKEYLGVTEVATGYYEIASYEEIMNEIVSVIELADRLSTDLGEIDIENPEGVSNFVSTFKQTIDELYGDDITSATKVIGNASKLTNDLLTGDEVSEYGDAIASAIDIAFESDVSDENRELANAIKTLLGVTNGAESGI